MSNSKQPQLSKQEQLKNELNELASSANEALRTLGNTGKNFVEHLYAIGRVLKKLGIARRGGSGKQIDFKGLLNNLSKFMISDMYAYKIFVRAWEDKLVGRIRFSKQVERGEPLSMHKNKRLKALGELDSETRGYVRRGIEYFIARVEEREKKKKEKDSTTAPDDQKNLANTLKLEQHFSGAIQGFRTPLQKELSILGYIIAAIFAFGCAFTTFAALSMTLPLFFTLSPVASILIPLAVGISTFYVNISIGKGLVGVFKSIFSDKGYFYGLTHYQRGDGKWERYDNAEIKLLVSFIVSLSVGATTAGVFYFFFIGAPLHFAVLAPYAFLFPPLAIITGVAALFTMTAVMMKINQSLFKGDFLNRIKGYTESIFSSDKLENRGKSTPQKVMQGILTGLVMLAYIPLVVFGLIATAWAGCGSLSVNILPHIFHASVTVYAYTGYFISMFLSILGQLPFVVVTSVKTVVLLSDLLVGLCFAIGGGIKSLGSKFINLFKKDQAQGYSSLNNDVKQSEGLFDKKDNTLWAKFKRVCILIWDRITSTINALGNAVLVHPSMHKTVNPITGQTLGPAARFVGVLGAGLMSLAAFAASLGRGKEMPEYLSRTARVMAAMQNKDKGLSDEDDKLRLTDDSIGLFSTLTGEAITEQNAQQDKADFVFLS